MSVYRQGSVTWATIRITLVQSSGRAAAPGLTPLRLPRAPKCLKCHKSVALTRLFSDVSRMSTFRSYISLSFGSDKSRILILATFKLQVWNVARNDSDQMTNAIHDGVTDLFNQHYTTCWRVLIEFPPGLQIIQHIFVQSCYHQMT